MKDPAVLFYIKDWLTSTAEMDADCRGWYLNLLLHNYDKGDLPNDLEKLAVLCNVKFSEYKRFEHVFEQVLKHKFEHNENLRLTNTRTNEILQSRELFKDKRSKAGKISYMMKYFAKNFAEDYKNTGLRDFVKKNFNYEIDSKNEQEFKQVFKHLFELYINENENVNKEVSSNNFSSNDINNYKVENFEKKSKNEIYSKELLESHSWVETVCMQNRISTDEIFKWIDKFNKKLISEQDIKFKKQEYASHFSRWLTQEISKEKSTAAKNNTQPSYSNEIWDQMQ